MATDRPKDNPVDREGTDLVNRLAQLSPVHPSGVRYFGDRKPADLAKPLSDAEYAKHAAEVREALSDAGQRRLATHWQHTTDGRGKVWMPDRLALHEEIISDLSSRASSVPCEGKAILAGGLPGAGKTTILAKLPEIDMSRYLMLNPDEIKEAMASRRMVPEIKGLSPMEATDLVHEESSLIAKRLAVRAYHERKNVIWDITMSGFDSTKQRIDDLRASGYRNVEGIFVAIPVEISIARSETRHREAHEAYLAGSGYGGRYIPREVIVRQADAVFGSTNGRVFEQVKPELNRWRLFDNSAEGQPAVLVQDSAWPGDNPMRGGR